jgi:manganese efflux pump family protein
VAVIALGAWMLTSREEDGEAASRISTVRGPALLALGLSISLDELAIGFSLGLARLPVIPVIIAIAVLALAVSQAGLAPGALISERLRERAGQAAGLALILLGAYLIAARAIS